MKKMKYDKNDLFCLCHDYINNAIDNNVIEKVYESCFYYLRSDKISEKLIKYLLNFFNN